jgi:hypothetical protein
MPCALDEQSDRFRADKLRHPGYWHDRPSNIAQPYRNRPHGKPAGVAISPIHQIVIPKWDSNKSNYVSGNIGTSVPLENRKTQDQSSSETITIAVQRLPKQAYPDITVMRIRHSLNGADVIEAVAEHRKSTAGGAI